MPGRMHSGMSSGMVSTRPESFSLRSATLGGCRHRTPPCRRRRRRRWQSLAITAEERWIQRRIRNWSSCDGSWQVASFLEINFSPQVDGTPKRRLRAFPVRGGVGWSIHNLPR